jgi:hypothetical protein
VGKTGFGDHDATPPIEDFLDGYEEDDNLWWRISCGHHQNLFDDAAYRIAEALKLHPAHCPTCGVDNCKTRRTLTHPYGGQE